MKRPAAPPCPCGSGHHYADCCQRLHTGTVAATAEQLMRSRYSAYALVLADYLLATWAAATRPGALDLATPPGKWIGLEIRHSTQTAADRATVEFIARCRIGGRAQRLHELSRFIVEDGRWVYLDGDQLHD